MHTHAHTYTHTHTRTHAHMHAHSPLPAAARAAASCPHALPPPEPPHPPGSVLGTRRGLGGRGAEAVGAWAAASWLRNAKGFASKNTGKHLQLESYTQSNCCSPPATYDCSRCTHAKCAVSCFTTPRVTCLPAS